MSEAFYATTGNIGYILLLGLTTFVTMCMIYQLPSEDLFDSNWLENGFCVSNPDTFWLNSHLLSFYADTIFAMIIAYLFFVQPKDAPPIQKALLSGAIMGVFGHGLGHLNLGFDPKGIDLRFRPNELIPSVQITLINIFALGSIFKSVMPLASNQRIALTSLISTIGFTLLNIEPKKNFVYAQAVIYIFNALHMLFLSKEHKETASYMIFPFLNLPVLVVGIMESTGCDLYLKYVGGHAVFDSTIALSVIMIELLSNRLQASTKQKVT